MPRLTEHPQRWDRSWMSAGHTCKDLQNKIEFQDPANAQFTPLIRKIPLPSSGEIAGTGRRPRESGRSPHTSSSKDPGEQLSHVSSHGCVVWGQCVQRVSAAPGNGAAHEMCGQQRAPSPPPGEPMNAASQYPSGPWRHRAFPTCVAWGGTALT